MILDLLVQLEGYCARGDWDELERHGRNMCIDLAGQSHADRIGNQDLLRYQVALRNAMVEALQAARRLAAGAIYFEYDMDNDWQGAFFICSDYSPASYGNDDWACDWREVIQGPSFLQLSELYKEKGFDRGSVATGSTVFLISRTVAALGRAMEGLDCDGLAVCAGFHDQDPVLRIRELE